MTKSKRVDVTEKTGTETMKIHISKLFVSKANPRKHFVTYGIEDLSKSIGKEGVQEPLHVYLDLTNSEGNGKNKYGVIAGQRRLLASQRGKNISLECTVHLDIKNLEDAYKWCNKELFLSEETSLIDKTNRTEELAQKYGNLKNACDIEGLPYEKMKPYYELRKLATQVREELSRGTVPPKTDILKLKSLLLLPEERQFEEWKKIEKLPRKQAIEDIKAAATPMSESSSLTDTSRLNPIIVEITTQTYKTLENFARKVNKTVEEYSKEVLEKHVETDKETAP